MFASIARIDASRFRHEQRRRRTAGGATAIKRPSTPKPPRIRPSGQETILTSRPGIDRNGTETSRCAGGGVFSFPPPPAGGGVTAVATPELLPMPVVSLLPVLVATKIPLCCGRSFECGLRLCTGGGVNGAVALAAVATLPVAADCAPAVPSGPAAVTTTRIVWPASLGVSVYAGDVAPAM